MLPNKLRSKQQNDSYPIFACDMRLHTQSDASYGTRSRGHSLTGGTAYLGNDDPTENNGPILVFNSIIQNVMASIDEAEYAAAFHTGQMASGQRKTLLDLGYPQPPSYILVDINEVTSIWNC